MHDLPILLILLALAVAAWWRPWLGVIVLIAVETVPPQGYARDFMVDFPAYLCLFVLVSARLILTAARALPGLDWRGLPGRLGQTALARDWQSWVFVLLGLDFLLTTWLAKDPWAAWPQWWTVGKALAPVLLTLVLIDSRDKLLALLLVLALSIAAATLKGGYWAIMTGFEDRVYGPPGSPYEANNEFAVAVLMTLPLLAAFRAFARHPGVRLILALLFILGILAVLSSWSRGALLGLGAVLSLLLWHSRRKWLAIPLLALSVAAAFVLLPEGWFGHMERIGDYQRDASAQGRIEAWRAGLAYAAGHPWVGSGFEGWRFLSPDGRSLLGRDWHSIYVQILTEHGLPGFLLWAALLFGAMARLSLLIGPARRRGDAQTASLAAMLRAGLAGYAVAGAFLGIAYWSLLFQMVALSMLLVWQCRRLDPMPAGKRYSAAGQDG